MTWFLCYINLVAKLLSDSISTKFLAILCSNNFGTAEKTVGMYLNLRIYIKYAWILPQVQKGHATKHRFNPNPLNWMFFVN
jgi:hypothetical protein